MEALGSCNREQEAKMLGSKSAAATLPVRDLQAARNFYENVLGLSPMQEMGEETPGGVLYKSGDSVVLVYESEYAGTNQGTAATWAVGGDFDAVVDGLREKGVPFEHYDNLPGTTRDGDIHTFGDMRAVWFKDPSGNILNVGDVPM
jgi:catechol 2,3-dioxygenase-like lactoylglutathione lyase family enzyme